MGKFRSLFKVRKPGNGQAVQDRFATAGKRSPKVTSRSNEYKKSSVK